MTKILMKFPPYIKKNLKEIIKIDKPHEKGLLLAFLKLLANIFTQNSMVKSHLSTGV